MNAQAVKDLLREELEKMVDWRVRDKLKHSRCDNEREAREEALDEINGMSNYDFMEELLAWA